MKKLITEYSFNPQLGQITFAEQFDKSQLLLITNTTYNTIIYNFANPQLGGTLVGNVLTLTAGVSAMGTGDSLQIYVDDGVAPASEASQGTISSLLQRILNALLSPLGYDKTLSRSRVTATIESMPVVSVSNMSNIDGVPARPTVLGINTTAWTLAVRERIS